jgi:parvulin-like peptidyl-prolyl isomerase
MPQSRLSIWVAGVLAVITSAAAAQQAPSPPAAAATVNGQAVTEVAVQRGLKRVPPAEHAKARPEILNYLIENVLIDQYLASQKIPVDPKEVEGRVTEIKSEVKKHGQDYAKMLTDLMLTEDELRAQIAADLRWEKHATAQGTDAALKDLFAKQPEMFDGSMVRARHILLTPTGDANAVSQAKAQLRQVKAQLEAQVTADVAKLPDNADPLARDQARVQRLADLFADEAKKLSTCPSKADGGDLNWFPRAGSMVEPFAAAAFALRPGQMSEPVQSPFGCHLILVTGRKPGAVTKFEDVKEEVREIFCQRLRESLVAQVRPTAKIVIAPVK